MPAKRCSTKSRIDCGQGSDDNARDVSRRLAAQSAVKFQMMFSICRHLLPGQSRSGPGTQFMLSRTYKRHSGGYSGYLSARSSVRSNQLHYASNA